MAKTEFAIDNGINNGAEEKNSLMLETEQLYFYRDSNWYVKKKFNERKQL